MKIYLLLNLLFSLSNSFIFPTKISHNAIEHCDVDNMDACCNPCKKCNFTGTTLCNFWYGTGFLTLKNELIGTGNSCPACKGTGEWECKDCMGAGKIARWRDNLKKIQKF